MHRIASALGSLILTTLVSAPAFADCIPGTGLCASAGVSIGIPAVQVGGQITIGLPPIVLPLPFGAPAAPPPAPAPVYQPPPPPVYVYPQQAPRPVYEYARPAPIWGSALGLDLRADAAGGFGHDRLGKSWGLGGAGTGLRFRAAPHFGVELGVDILGGRDYNDNKSTEISGNLGGLLYVNPGSRAQFYFSGGILADHANATDDHAASVTQGNNTFSTPVALQYDHVGGYAGLGLEVFLTRHLALHLDMRGMARQRVGGSAGSNPEFTDPTNGRTTNTSVGVLGSAGAVLYF